MTLDSTFPEDDVLDIIQRIFKNYHTKPSIEIKPGSNVGEGFLGITATVIVKFDDDVRHLFIKKSVQDEQLRKVTFQQVVFNKEDFFYSKIYSTFNDLCLKHTQKAFDITPQCLYSSTENLKECIILDNLVQKGYKVLKTREPFNKEHLLMALKVYSHLHACGFILKKENPAFFEELQTISKRNYFVEFGKLYGFSKMASKCLDILKSHCSSEEDKTILDNLEPIKSKVMKSLESIGNVEEYCTIIHLDCWRNNLMFKYKDNGELEDMKLIDFQMWTINTPLFDLLHLIPSNAQSKEILENLDYYLDYYHSSLSEILIEMGGNPKELFPREALFQQWKKHASYGVLQGLISTRSLLGGAECMPNTVEFVKANKPLDEAFLFDLPNEEDYSRRIKVILNHFIKHKLI